jgi:hypothetical protein
MAATWKVARVPASLVAVVGALVLALTAAPRASAALEGGGGGACSPGRYWAPAVEIYGAGTSSLNANTFGCDQRGVHIVTGIQDRVWDRLDARLKIDVLASDGDVLWTGTYTEGALKWRSVTIDTKFARTPTTIRRTISRTADGGWTAYAGVATVHYAHLQW